MRSLPLPATDSVQSAKQPTIPPEGSSTVLSLDDYRQPDKLKQASSPIIDATADQKHIYFPLIVDSDFSSQAQDILRNACGDALDEITLQPLPRKHQTKLLIHLKPAAYGIALHALILGLPAAEFGSVIHTGITTPHL